MQLNTISFPVNNTRRTNLILVIWTTIFLNACSPIFSRFLLFDKEDEAVFSRLFEKNQIEIFFVEQNVKNSLGKNNILKEDSKVMWFFRQGAQSSKTYVIYSDSLHDLLRQRDDVMNIDKSQFLNINNSKKRAEVYSKLLLKITNFFKEKGFELTQIKMERMYLVSLLDRILYVFFSLGKSPLADKLVFGARSSDYKTMKSRRSTELLMKTFYLIPNQITQTKKHPDPILNVRPYNIPIMLRRLYPIEFKDRKFKSAEAPTTTEILEFQDYIRKIYQISK